MATKLLDESRIHALHQAALDAGLAAHRADLLRGLDSSFVASLPVSSSLSAQLLTDLNELGITLRDGSMPIVAWLKNASSLAGGRSEVVVFEEALKHLGEPVPARATTPVRKEAPQVTAGNRLDVVILVALQDELEAVLALGDRGRAGWDEKRDLQRFRYFRRSFPRESGRDLVIAAAWIGEMGERAAASRGQQLVQELNPACLAMCGICAGWRKKLALGDIVVADRLYSYDHGKIVVATGGEEELFHDIETFSLEKTWKMDAAFFARALSLGALAAERPPSREAQRLWLLDALFAHETEGAPAPRAREEWKRACPDHGEILVALEAEGLVDLGGVALALTEGGRKVVRRERHLHPDGRKVDRELRIEVGALATGKTVREDPELFERLARLVRSTIAVDMEGMAIAEVAERFGRQAIVVKAVSDHADHEKDDRYRAFACKASATFLLAFLLKHLNLDPPSARRTRRPSLASGREPEGVALFRRATGFVERVEQVCRLRVPNALLQPQTMLYPFDGALMVIVPKTPVTHRELHVALEQPITEDAIGILVGEILPALRCEGPLPCKLVHLGPTAPVELALRAEKLDIELITFSAYQGLVDFTRYKAWLSLRLENDAEYPPSLYVEQPASVSLAGQTPELVPNALARLGDLLTAQERRFALILGDFGAGKSFLLRELARTLLAGDGSLVPVLVEMRYLEKQLDLRGLLSQHFGMANAGSVDIDAFLYMLHQGRVVLLFDGFDELAVRVTYEQVLQHFAVITGAVEGNAKVIVSSRRQHFLDDGRVKLELARSAERLQGYRLVELQPFEEEQIRQFLRNRLKDEAEADARYRLIHDVKDLLGLSHNPRMLGFIADLERERLEGARDAAGEITPAKLYEVLLERWLDGECKRTQVKKVSLWSAVRVFARKLWETPGNAVDLGSLPKDLVPRLDGLKAGLSEEEARLVLGSRSLLKRDAEGLFSFVHRSVLEWLVAGEALMDVQKTGDTAVLDVDAMSPLMARFFVNLAGKEVAAAWVRWVFATGKGDTAQKNALAVAAELKLALAVDLEGQDLRGVSLAGLNLRGANLRGVNLEGATLGDRDLAGVDLTGARLARADLRGAALTGADLTAADLSFAKLVRADLSEAKLTGTRLLGAKLLGAKGLSYESRASAEREGAAVFVTAMVGEIALTPAACNAVSYHSGGHVLATGHNDGTLRLWDAATGHELRALSGHTADVLSVVFSPDGQSLASGSGDETVRLWSAVTGAELRALSGHTARVMSVAFSPDGQSLASGSEDKSVRLWNAATGAELHALLGHTRGVGSVAFSPDGQSLVSGSDDKTVTLWAAGTGHKLRSLSGHTTRVLSGVFSSVGPWLTYNWANKTVTPLDGAAGHKRELSGYSDVVWSIAFSPDGRSLASGSDDSTVRLWDVSTGTERRALSGHTKGIKGVAYSPDGRSLVSGSEDNSVRLWDATTGHQLHVLSGHSDRVSSVAFNPDGRSLASGSSDMTVRLWNVATGAELRALSGQIRGAGCMAFSRDGRSLASGSEDRRVTLWDAATGHKQRVLSGHTGRVLSVAFSPDGKSLASGSDDTTVRLWDTTTGHEHRRLSWHTASVGSIAFSPDGRSLASGSWDSTVRLWDATTGQARRALWGHTESVLSVVFSPDGLVLASGAEDKYVRLWDAVTGQKLRALSGHTKGVSSVAFSPDSRSLASGSEDRTVRLWDAANGQELSMLSGHSEGVGSVAFSPDGRSLASGSADKTVRLWDAATSGALRVLLGHTERVLSVAFSPDGRSLASASADGTIRLWDTASGHCLAVLLSTPEGWVSYVPEAHPGGPPRGAFKMGGDIAGSFWHMIGLARFEPGELDEFLPEGQKLRLPDDYLFLPPAPPALDRPGPPR